MSNSKVLALCNQKGGVGKTMSTASLGVGLAALGKKVMVVDLDPQSDLTTSLGWPNQDELPVTIATIMDKIIRDEPFNPAEGILKHPEGVDLMPSSIELSAMEMSLVNAMSREFTLRTYLNEIKHNYDYVLIDCMPSLGMITINALAASDAVIIPVQAHYLPAKGMTQLLRTVERVRKQVNPNLKVAGVLITLVDARTNLAKNTSETLRANYGRALNIFKTEIPIAVTAAETTATGKSIFAYDKTGTVANAYAKLAKEVVENGEKKRARNDATLCR